MMKIFLHFLSVAAATVLLVSHGFGAVTCVEVPGEAAVKGNDIHSAREEAVTRAKWKAIEMVAGIEVSGERVLQNNMRIVDEAVIRRFNGLVQSCDVLTETPTAGSIHVVVKACIETTQARRAMESFSRNQSITVVVPVKGPRLCGGGARDDANDFTETVMEGLTARGYTVHDSLSAAGLNGRQVGKVLANGQFLSFRNVMYRYLSNILIIGTIDQSEGKGEGDDIGFGLEMPANLVRSRLLYRIVRKTDDGDMTVLTAGTETGKGFGHDPCDAARDSLKDLAENLLPSISRKLQEHVAGIAKKVTVRVTNITDLNTNFAVKAILQNTAWVEAVEEQSLGEFTVTYREKAVYLANSLVQRGNFTLVNFSPERITLEYEHETGFRGLRGLNYFTTKM